jgi:eukaryotic-like serine/threonine-protein kinase
MSTLAQLSAGTLFANDFRVVRPLADGGMGSVYVVEQLSTGRERALKLMHPQFVADPANRKRFADEARAGARIESDHVVEVIAAGVDEASGVPWLAMELLQGETLFDRVEKRGPVPPAEAYEILRQVCHALGAAHRGGLVHRDVKPENIFLASTRRDDVAATVKVLDFGIAKVVQDARGAATGSMGTPLWMAPEQTETHGIIGPPTDVWAIGLLAYYLLTGRIYWAAGNASVPAMMREMLFGEIRPASVRAAESGVASLVPASFDAWFAGAVQRDPAKRFPDATVAAQTLEAALQGRPPARTVAAAPGVAATVAIPMFQPGGAVPGAWPSTLSAPPGVPGAPAMQVAATVPASSGKRSRAPWIVAAVVLCSGGALAAALAMRSDPTTTPDAPVTPVATTTATPAPTTAPTPTAAPTPMPIAEPTTPTAPAPRAPAAPVRRPTVTRPATPAPATPAPAPTPPAPTPPAPTPATPEPAPTPDVPAAGAPDGPRGPRPNIPISEIIQQGSQLGRERLATELERYLQQNPGAADAAAIRDRIGALRGQPRRR